MDRFDFPSFFPCKMWPNEVIKMKPSWNSSLLFELVGWLGESVLGPPCLLAEWTCSYFLCLFTCPLAPARQGWPSGPHLTPETSLGILSSETKLTHCRDSPGRHRSCKCTYTVNQHTLFNHSHFKLFLGGRGYHPRTNTNC